MYPQVVIHPHKEKAIERKHPWIFSGAIQSTSRTIENGEIVSVVDVKKNVLAIGHFQNGSISVRVLSFEDVAIDQQFFNDRLQNAFELRKKLNLTNNDETNIYRLVHAEG
ncbi:MAG: class I SAM-dependent rRNA methyltransferase, partial [Bacteroidia bacterium]